MTQTDQSQTTGDPARIDDLSALGAKLAQISTLAEAVGRSLDLAEESHETTRQVLRMIMTLTDVIEDLSTRVKRLENEVSGEGP